MEKKNDESTTPHEPEPQPAKKPYKAPRLRFLGSVRDLTWGDAGRYADGIASQEKP